MIKEIEVTETIKKRHKYCDECGMEIITEYSSTHCKMCSKDLCRKCIGYEENDRLSDYSDIYCKKCWNIGESYRSKIKAMEDDIEELYVKWYNECNECCSSNHNI